MAKERELDRTIRILSRHQDIKIDEKEKEIQINRNHTIGIKTWGHIDYLTSVHGFVAFI